MSQSFKHASAQALLDKMFNKSRYFSICDVDTLGELVGRNPAQHPDYPALRALHCVDYKDMPTAVRESLPEKVLGCLRPEGYLDPARMSYALMAEGRDFQPTEDEQFPRLVKQ